jgi:UPF0716 protein FxsA
MRMILLILFVAVPLLEIAVLIKVGQWLGFWPTLMLVAGTFVAGAAVVSRSGFTAALRVQEALAKGEPPAAAMLEGALLVLAGVLLMTPGLVADLIGLALLVPPLRRQIAGYAARRVLGATWVHAEGSNTGQAASEQGRAPGAGAEQGPIIEGEFERIDERPVDPHRRPGSHIRR